MRNNEYKIDLEKPIHENIKRIMEKHELYKNSRILIDYEDIGKPKTRAIIHALELEKQHTKKETWSDI